MRKSIKIFILLWLGLLLIVGLLFYNDYSRLKPESMVALLTEQAQKNFPGASLEVDKFDYRPSIDFNISFKNIVLRRADKVLGRLGELEFRVPWWLLILNRGKAQINLTDLVIFVDETVSEITPAEIKSAVPKVSLDLPRYFEDAQFTLRAKDISIKDFKTSRNLFRLSKLLVREFRYGKNSAFEIKIPISLGFREMQYASELWLFGDVTPDTSAWTLNYRGEFRTRDTAEKPQFEDIIINGKTRFDPSVLNMHSELELSVDKEQMGKGIFSANDLEFHLDLNLSKLPVSFLGPFEAEFQNPYFKKWDGYAQGPIKVHKKFKDNKISFHGNLTFPGQFQLDDKDVVEGQWRVDLDDAVWQASFISPKGDLSYFRRSVIDFSSGKVNQYSEELGFTGVPINMAIKALPSLEKQYESDPDSYFSSKIVFKNCIWNNSSVDGSFQSGTSPAMKIYNLAMQVTPGGSLNLNFEQSGEQRKLDLTVVKFPWNSQFNFLQPYFHSIEGTYDGKLEGRWKKEWWSGEWLLSMKVAAARDLQGKVSELNKSFWGQFSMDPSAFESQVWKAGIRNGTIKIDSLVLEGIDPAKMTGLLDSSKKQRSFLSLNYPKNKKWKTKKKEIAETFWQKD